MFTEPRGIHLVMGLDGDLWFQVETYPGPPMVPGSWADLTPFGRSEETFRVWLNGPFPAVVADVEMVDRSSPLLVAVGSPDEPVLLAVVRLSRGHFVNAAVGTELSLHVDGEPLAELALGDLAQKPTLGDSLVEVFQLPDDGMPELRFVIDYGKDVFFTDDDLDGVVDNAWMADPDVQGTGALVRLDPAP